MRLELLFNHMSSVNIFFIEHLVVLLDFSHLVASVSQLIQKLLEDYSDGFFGVAIVLHFY